MVSNMSAISRRRSLSTRSTGADEARRIGSGISMIGSRLMGGS
jgi:hypothetical protein